MIIADVDFLTAVSFGMSAFLCGISLIWLFHARTEGREKAGTLDPRFVWVCGVCTYNYVNTREESISVCPRCGSYNKK